MAQVGINGGLSDRVKPRTTDIAYALLARNYKGPSNLVATTLVGVNIEEDTDDR